MPRAPAKKRVLQQTNFGSLGTQKLVLYVLLRARRLPREFVFVEWARK